MTDAGGRDRPTESAAFEPARLAGPGGPGGVRPPVLGVAFVAVLAIVVAAGLSGRSSPGAFPVSGENIALASGGASSGEPIASFVPPSPAAMPAFPADTGPLLTSGPGDLQLQAKRHPESIFVHGDVFVPRVTWVFVSLQDDSGLVAGWASVSVPGAAGPAASGGPTLRFDIEVAIPAAFVGRLWVQAQAYDSGNGLVATARLEAPGPTR